jgi:hypothetical protein
MKDVWVLIPYIDREGREEPVRVYACEAMARADAELFAQYWDGGFFEVVRAPYLDVEAKS